MGSGFSKYNQEYAHQSEQGTGEVAGQESQGYEDNKAQGYKWQPQPQTPFRAGADDQNPYDTSTDRFAWMGGLSNLHY